MTYFECRECNGLLDIAGTERARLVRDCPTCGRVTQWTLAFVDEDQGVSF